MYGDGRGPTQPGAKMVEREMLDVLGSMRGVVNGLIPGHDVPQVHPLQEGRMVDMSCGCAVPSHCFRSVSQRSLSVPTRFSSDVVTVAPGAPGGLLTPILSDLATGAAPGIDLTADSIVFNDANVQTQRGRINELVLLGVRAAIRVIVLDATAVGAGSIDLAALGRDMEREIAKSVYLSMWHMADRRDPWMDKTPLDYFLRPSEEFLPVPPLKWIDRDPAMGLSLRAFDFGNDPGAGAGIPLLNSTVRSLDVKLDFDIECLFIPDPNQCGNYWPGEICPKNTIGNTEWYDGHVKTARVTATGRG